MFHPPRPARQARLEPLAEFLHDARMLARRSLLRVASGAAFASLLAGLGRPRPARAAGIYGELVSDPDGILDLPPGFKYRILERFGDPMDDGHVVPALPDGMACFPGEDGTVVLMRNHELIIGDGPYEPGLAPAEAYDPLAMGCVTRVVLDAVTFERISSNLVLCGTLKNCAGGPSPWGWLTCEEIAIAGHGFVFACDPSATSVRPPFKISAYGRCKREAACVDPARNIAYLTEDQQDSALYRFLPDDPAQPFVGRLQALRIVGHDAYEMSDLAQGDALSIAWVDLDDPDPPGDTLRVEARSKGAAVFDRGEGITFFDGQVFMIATTGGPLGKGQIFRIVDHPQAPTIEALLVVTDAMLVDQPDNVTVAPWGDLFFGEDGSGGNFIRGVTPDGQLFDFAHNVLTSGEIAGVCFSPDGRALFANLWGSGLTFVITGPFPAAPEPPADDSSGAESSGQSDDSGADPGDSSSSVDPFEMTSGGPDTPTTGLTDDDATTDPLEVGGAFEELTCACRSDPGTPDAATVLSVTTAVIAAAPTTRCDMQPGPSEVKSHPCEP
jgi:secreted PhoX family phosphatase